MDILAKPIANIISLSLNEGNSPELFKQAHVFPLLKKPSLLNDFKTTALSLNLTICPSSQRR